MATVKGSFPARVDDTGTGRDGTPVDVAFIDAIGDAIDAETLSATNPTVTTKDIQDEVVASRGSEASLDARLDVEHNEDGTHKALPYATVTQLLGGIGGVNLVQNDDFLLWPDGDAAAPDGYVLAGAGAAVARTGTGLGDTSRKIGDFACKVTRAAADVSLTRSILAAAGFTRADFLKARYAAGGAWVWCATPNAARVAVYDGAGYEYSAYHTGGGTWEWLPATRLINNAATVLDVVAKVENAAVAAIFSGFSLAIVDSDLDLPHEVVCPVLYGTMHFAVAGVLAATANVGRFLPSRPGIVKDVQLHVKTAPTGAAIDVDVNTNTNVPASTVYPTLASMFTATHPTIAAADFMGGRQPDGTYARRCLRGPTSGATVVGAGGLLTIDIDVVGSGVAGADLGGEVRVLQYQSPLERFQTF
jgi:hypothetical protein